MARDALERLTGFGRAQAGVSRVLRPRSVAELEELFAHELPRTRTLALRGAGRSYGDAALNDGGTVLDTSELRGITAWDPDSGVIEVEPGVTIEDLWRRTLPDGWWPPGVSGTMTTSLGGCVAMNVHGKNCFAVGPIGDHVRELELLLPGGERVVCGPELRPELFRGVVASAGLLGCIVRIRLALKRVYSGNLRVTVLPAHSLPEMAEIVEATADSADYLVGWTEALSASGRGVVHRADYLPEGEDPHPERTLREQDVPRSVFGIPRSWALPIFRLVARDPGMRLVNAAKYRLHTFENGRQYLESHASYAFLLDYVVPDWVRGYGRAGMIQVQPFVPREGGARVLEEILRLTRRRGLPPYLVVFKKHRADRFLLSHGLDGYSLAMDFPARRRAELWALAREIHARVADAGGRFYFAKDSTLDPESVRRSFPEQDLRAFVELKRKCDPEGLLQTNLARRVFPDWFS
jgi:FAD/FMN-containing dehydrogenase